MLALAALPFVALLFALLLVSTHQYWVAGFVEPLPLASPLRSGIRAAIYALGASLFVFPILERTAPLPILRVLAWPISIWMGVFFIGFLMLAASDLLVRLPAELLGMEFVSRAEARAAGGWWWEQRALLLSALLAVVTVVALFGGLRPPRLRRVEIELARWPAALDGYRIVQISDIHIGPILGRSFAEHLRDRVNALDPDLVAVTGDLVDGPVRTLRHEVEPFAEIGARDGVFFVTGNHDHYSGDSAWVERVGDLGWTALRNRRVTIDAQRGDSAPGARFELAGVDDHRGGMLPGSEGGEDLDAALGDLPPRDASRGSLEPPAVVLLAHDPSTFKRAHARGIDLQISGHTHGGQIWPFRYAVRAAIPFVAGRYSRAGAELYVSRGTGFWGPPMRLGAPAEITEFVLRRSR